MNPTISCIKSTDGYNDVKKDRCDENGCVAKHYFNKEYLILKADKINRSYRGNQDDPKMCDYIIFWEKNDGQINTITVELKSGTVDSNSEYEAILCKFQNGDKLAKDMVSICNRSEDVTKNIVRQLFVRTYGGSEYTVWAKKHDIRLKRCGEWIDTFN